VLVVLRENGLLRLKHLAHAGHALESSGGACSWHHAHQECIDTRSQPIINMLKGLPAPLCFVIKPDKQGVNQRRVDSDKQGV